MRVATASYGSSGDFLPTLAVAGAMVRRGHEVTLVANPVYAGQAAAAGVRFVPAGAPRDLSMAIRESPDLLDPLRGGGRLIRDWLVPDIAAVYPAMRDLLAGEPHDCVIAANTAYGGSWAAMERCVPSVLVAATPLVWLNPRAPMPLTPWRLPDGIDGLLMRTLRAITGLAMGRVLRGAAATCGTRCGDVSYEGPARAAVLHAGMWSPQVRPLAPGDPPGALVCGAARASGLAGAGAELSPAVREFLEAGPPPVVVALGSVFSQGNAPLLRNLAEACVALGERCLVVGHLPGERLPVGVMVVPAEPYEALFPRARGVVVHGGAGSTSEALRAGRPIGVLPFGFDQYALGRVVERLGCGVTLGSRSNERLRSGLRRLLDDPAIRQRAETVGRGFAAEPDGAEVLAREIEARAAGAGPTRAVSPPPSAG